MMLGIGLGVMALLCAVGLIAGGGLLMHHEGKQEKDKEPQVIQQDHDPGMAAERFHGKVILVPEKKDPEP